MSLSDSERRILEELEQAFGAEAPQLAKIERVVRRQRFLIRATAPLGFLAAVLLVVVGVGVGGVVATALGVLGYLLAASAAYVTTTAWGPTLRALHWK